MDKSLLRGLAWLSVRARRGWPGCSAAFVVTLGLLAACGGGGGGDSGSAPPPSAGFELRLGSASIAAPADSSGLLRVRVERDSGFSGPIEIGLTDPPAGISADTVVVEQADEAQLPLKIAADVAPGAVDIVITGSSGAATTRLPLRIDVQAARPRSQELIRQALDAGRIDLGTSLLYRAYAVFGDSRLPEAFVGSGPAEEDTALFADIEDARPSLPQTILDQLQPYLARPDDPLSVFNEGQPTQRERPARERTLAVPPADRCSGGTREWITLRSAQHPVRAWALCGGTHGSDESARNDVFRVIDVVDRAYGGMVALMGPAKPDLYGDDAIDVYVVPPNADAPRASGDYAVEGVRGVAPSQPPYAGRTSSGYVMLPTWRLAEADYQLTVIHELFHVLQFAHNFRLSDYWFTEASATWSSFHFNRKAPIRPSQNTGLHDERFDGYQSSTDSLLSTAGDHEYYSYAWPMFMEHKGGAEMVGGAWRQLAGAGNHEQATNALDFLLPFKENLRDFGWRNLNEEYQPGDGLPRDKRYVGLDGAFPDRAHQPQNKAFWSIDASTDESVALGEPLQPLSAGYIEIEQIAADVRQVVFGLEGLQVDGLGVSALVNIDGTWESEPRHLDGKNELRFCLDRPEERLKDIVFIVANHQKQLGAALPAQLHIKGSALPCRPIWEGTVTARFDRTTSLSRFSATTTAQVAFEFDETAPHGPSEVLHRLRGGSYTHDSRLEQPNRNPACRTLESTSGIMGPGPLNPLQRGSTTASLVLLDTGSPQLLHLGNGFTAVEMVQTSNCNDANTDVTITIPGMTLAWWAMQQHLPVSDDGKTLSGDVTTPDGAGGTVRYTWQFTLKDQ